MKYLEGGLAPNATVMSWRGEEGGIEAAKQHHKVIMTPGGLRVILIIHKPNRKTVLPLVVTCLLKLFIIMNLCRQNFLQEEQKYIIGAQANLWTEYIANNAKVEYMLFPRIEALSEVLWSPKENRNWDDFKNRLHHNINDMILK